MKNLVCVLILLFASPAFAGGNFSAFDGANEAIEDNETNGVNETQEVPAVTQKNPVVEPETDFRINERLYSESIGANGYYGGGFYGEEKNQAQVPYYTITSRGRNSGFISNLVIVDGQIISPFNSSFGFFPNDISVNIGNFSFLSGGFIGRGFGFGSFGRGSFGFGRH